MVKPKFFVLFFSAIITEKIPLKSSIDIFTISFSFPYIPGTTWGLLLSHLQSMIIYMFVFDWWSHAICIITFTFVFSICTDNNSPTISYLEWLSKQWMGALWRCLLPVQAEWISGLVTCTWWMYSIRRRFVGFYTESDRKWIHSEWDWQSPR